MTDKKIIYPLIFSLKALIWYKYRKTIIKFDTPHLVCSNLETELYIYNLLNNKRNNLLESIREKNQVNIDVFHPEKMCQYGVFVLECMFSDININFSTAEDYIDQLISYNNFEMVEFLFYQTDGDTVKKYILENATKYLVRICTNSYINMFENFMKMCKDLNVKFALEGEKVPLTQVPRFYWRDEYQNFHRAYNSKTAIISAIENDDVNMLKLLEKHEFEIYDEDIVKYASFNMKNKCYSHLLGRISYENIASISSDSHDNVFMDSDILNLAYNFHTEIDIVEREDNQKINNYMNSIIWSANEYHNQ